MNATVKALVRGLWNAGADGLHTLDAIRLAPYLTQRMADVRKFFIVVTVPEPGTQRAWYYMIRRKTLGDRKKEYQEELARKRRMLAAATPLPNWTDALNSKHYEFFMVDGKAGVVTKKGVFLLPEPRSMQMF